MVTLTEVSSERHVSRFTASNLEKHDWQAPMLSDPYFLHSDSRVDSQSFDTPDRGQDASGRLTTGRPRARSTQRHFTCFRELQKQVTEAERTKRRQLCDAQVHWTPWQRGSQRTRLTLMPRSTAKSLSGRSTYAAVSSGSQARTTTLPLAQIHHVHVDALFHVSPYLARRCFANIDPCRQTKRIEKAREHRAQQTQNANKRCASAVSDVWCM